MHNPIKKTTHLNLLSLLKKYKQTQPLELCNFTKLKGHQDSLEMLIQNQVAYLSASFKH